MFLMGSGLEEGDHEEVWSAQDDVGASAVCLRGAQTHEAS
jgi:hypothetical protein